MNTTTTPTVLEASTFQRRPAYSYIRRSDKLPGTLVARSQGITAAVKVKIFDPCGAATFYVTGYDPETRLATGAVDLGFGLEVGEFSMPELVAVRNRFRLPLERDLWWSPKTTLAAVLDGTTR